METLNRLSRNESSARAATLYLLGFIFGSLLAVPMILICNHVMSIYGAGLGSYGELTYYVLALSFGVMVLAMTAFGGYRKGRLSFDLACIVALLLIVASISPHGYSDIFISSSVWGAGLTLALINWARAE
jgi:hypothetical protein